MYKIAVMGESDSIYGFATLGLDTYPTDTPESAQKTLRSLAENNYAVVYITEACASVYRRRSADTARSGSLPSS